MKAIVKALNERGLAALLWHRREEEEYTKKVKRIPKAFRSKQAKKFLKLKSVMLEDREIITGFNNNDEATKKVFIESVKKGLEKENGASPEDYEVLFSNE